MPRAFVSLLAAIAFAGATACGKTSSTTVAGPSPAKCQLTATNSTPSFSAAGGRGAIVIQAARECTWAAAAQASWVAVLPPSEGQGDSTVNYTVQSNPSGLPRRGTVNVAGQLVEVGQEGAPCRFELDRPSVQVGAFTTSVDVSVSGPAGCAWTAASEAPWITVAQGGQGVGPGPVVLSLAPNTGGRRTGTVLVAGIRFEVTQGSTLDPPPPPPPDCSFTVTPSDAIAAGAGGATGIIGVSTAGSCAWSATASDPWIDLSTSGASGPGQVTYTIEPNTLPTERTGTMTVAGTTITVQQDSGQEITLAGVALNVTGSCPVQTFTLETRSVTTNAATSYRNGSCGRLKSGESVSVRGVLTQMGTVDAFEVEFTK